MKIGIDIRCLMQKNYSGVSWYTFNLIKTLLEFDSDNSYILFYNNSKPVIIPDLKGRDVTYAKFNYPNKLLNQSFNVLKKPQIDKLMGGVGILFMPNINFAAYSNDCQRVITVHDLSYLRYPQFWTFKSRLWHKILIAKKILQTADVIIAVSNNTKRDLIDLLKIPEEKIRVIYEGVDKRFGIINNEAELERVRRKYKLPGKFMLYLGTLEPRKNIEGIIRAYNNLNSDHGLIIAGGQGWKMKDIYKMARGNEKIKLIGYVTEKDKRALYNLADVFVYPSYYEGFGLPPIEAMACGTPVIAGANSSQIEVVKNAGLLVDVHNINEIKKAMELLLTDEELRTGLIKRGLEIAKTFDWRDTAINTLGVFNDIIKKPAV